MNDPVIEDKSKMNDRKALIIGCAIGLALIICLGCLAATGAWAYFTAKEIGGSDYFFAPTSVVSDGQPVPHNIPEEFVGFEHETIETLQNTVVPFNDPVDLARRLKGLENVPDLLIDVNAPHKVGEKMEFNITNTSTNKNFKTKAVLEYVTDHSYFWVQEGVNFNANHLEALAEAFENDIYPTNREFFGSEWSPGVDGDNHIYILYVKGTGANNAGYFSSSDSLHPLAHENSNAHETFVFNADNVSFDDEFTYGVLAHEFQHMIHWNLDRNEESWINEGFSEVATLLNGYDPGGFEYAYINNTDLQLTDWPNNPNATTPHYGASFLFLTYFLDRFGEHATQALVAHPDNGIESVDKVLADIEAQDLLTGEAIGADDVVMDWAITNFLLDPKVSDGRYFYNNYPNAPKAPASQGYPDCSPGSKNYTVHQYGIDYTRFFCSGSVALRFEGALYTPLLPEGSHSGQKAFWSNKGDRSNMTLTKAFDFTDESGPLTLSYWTWYDIEADYDYIYLVVSDDGGESWQIVQTPSSTDANPSGNSYGWAFNDTSGRWINEEVDLSGFAGKEVIVRFEYVTDDAVNGEGLLLDDVSIPEIDYFTDFEEDDGGWVSEGWVRVANILPQTFELALIKIGNNTEIEYLTLGEDNALDINLEIGGQYREIILVITGTTRFTRQVANYNLIIE